MWYGCPAAGVKTNVRTGKTGPHAMGKDGSLCVIVTGLIVEDHVGRSNRVGGKDDLDPVAAGEAVRSVLVGVPVANDQGHGSFRELLNVHPIADRSLDHVDRDVIAGRNELLGGGGFDRSGGLSRKVCGEEEREDKAGKTDDVFHDDKLIVFNIIKFGWKIWRAGMAGPPEDHTGKTGH
jgi:hypothetical protein